MNRAELKKEIQKKLDAGLSVQLCSPSSWGGSRWLRDMEMAGRKMVFVDGDLQPFVRPRVEDIDPELPTTFVIDHFDSLLKAGEPELFNYLRSIRDTNKYYVTFVVLNNGCLELSQFAGKLDRFYELVTESRFEIPAFNEEETKQVIENVGEKYQIAVKKEELAVIAAYSGGIPSLVKTAMLEGRNLDQLSDRARGILGRIWESLTSVQKKQLRLVAEGKETELDSYLVKTGIVEEFKSEKLEVKSASQKFKVKSAALEKFIKDLPLENDNEEKGHSHGAEIDNQLTAIEHRLFDCMLSKMGQVCSRDDLIAAAWPDDNAEGVSDEALDQAVSRLRRKLNGNGYEVRTVKGRGYLLAISN